MNIIDRFMAKVEKTESCWVWTARKTPQGYGRFCVGNVNKLAHRVAFEIFRKTITDSLHVLHSCDNPSCVNPDHLWLGTNVDNVADKVSKNRVPSGVGELNHNSRLSPLDVLAIREMAESRVKRSQIAKQFGIAPNYVNLISSRKVWRHL